MKNDIRHIIREMILLELKEADNDAIAVDKLEDVFDDFERDIKKTDLEDNVNEGIGLTLAGIALSLPEILKLIGKFINLIKKIPGFKKLSGDTLIKIGDKYHHKIMGAFEFIIKKAGVKDSKKAEKFAHILFHVLIAMLLFSGGKAMVDLTLTGSYKAATLKGALNAVKTKEIGEFLHTLSEKI